MSDELVTYKMADGSLIGGEFSWTTDLEFFDEGDDPSEVVREWWRLVRRERLRINPAGYVKPCEACDTEGIDAEGKDCGPCAGDGYIELERVETL
jgi:hypothetical protein